MGLLDEMLGGLMGATGQGPTGGRGQAAGGGIGSVLMALTPVVLGMLANRGGGVPQAGAAPGGIGGLGDLLDRFRSAGYGDQANSWVSTGQNLPISPDVIGKVFGQGGLGEIARRAGVTEQQASEGLSQLVPAVVDHVTPGGQVPDFDQLNSSVDKLLRNMGT
jgi:uncharacterized protein YidB (DUF937 family)